MSALFLRLVPPKEPCCPVHDAPCLRSGSLDPLSFKNHQKPAESRPVHSHSRWPAHLALISAAVENESTLGSTTSKYVSVVPTEAQALAAAKLVILPGT